METDRELLVLAAKAAGIKVTGYDASVRVYESPHFGCPALLAPNEDFGYWNPLTDDGDALRLAVKLAKKVGMPFAALIANFLHQEQEQEGDDCAATRRAIVRAAAEIGKCVQ